MSRKPKRIHVLGFPIDNLNIDQTLKLIIKECENKNKHFIVAQNPEKIIAGLKDNELAIILKHKATLLIPDGFGLIIAAIILGESRLSRVTGIQLFEKLLDYANEEGKRVFFFGGKPEVNHRLIKVVSQRYPNLIIAGHQHGYEKDHGMILSKINEVKPDFLFVALGSPRQEKWIAKYFDNLPVYVAMGVGGSFDVLTGYVKRAPKWMQKIGLEWLYRLYKQPSRYRRMLRLPLFLWRVIRYKFTRSI
ncbi:N-acetylglucosaminyldiphosphoundecaprenol N-acetyl-beta-D-mannosaminyltransferase [Caldalkalibacillus uzonensis]|uniref:N-acetylglucosaminyldiphosphoundecaprenol N-acetyl-beta-D-mannosaminyltransferase n=1 Tax=Caldalkalibacillus uzonensis TaxID=353224 RepID=A0ABU0CQ13_9BACI|nr:WecB/TagA/CpsF family glycosyltransferase [Caldalkalibacillus uzonensis]MDQ0338499.1 N-acetylglucosaminyldiphosphoundecaprenol N-acetyl-beta-D-mannosaminyltransferase [Caldalkalibacillus uzonensis]